MNCDLSLRDSEVGAGVHPASNGRPFLRQRAAERHVTTDEFAEDPLGGHKVSIVIALYYSQAY